jgi:DNA repair exonuclease SbcCD ATPase subunit
VKELITSNASLRSELAAERRANGKEVNTLRANWQADLERHERETVDRLRAQDEEVRAGKQALQARREQAEAEAAEAAAEAEELARQTQELSIALERVRSSSKAGLLQQVAELQTKVRELNTPRSGAVLTIKEANLWKQAAAQSSAAAAKQRSRLNDFWASEREAERELEKVQARLDAAEKQCQNLKQQLKEQLAEITRLKAVAEPGKERFKTGNHFSAAVDLSIVQVLCLGIARKKVRTTSCPAMHDNLPIVISHRALWSSVAGASARPL